MTDYLLRLTIIGGCDVNKLHEIRLPRPDRIQFSILTHVVDLLIKAGLTLNRLRVIFATKHYYLRRYTNMYSKKPLTLMELSRIRILRSSSTNYLLLIEQANLPESLKQYLAFNVDYRRLRTFNK